MASLSSDSCHIMLFTGPACTQTLGGKYGRIHRFIRVKLSSINMIYLEEKKNKLGLSCAKLRLRLNLVSFLPEAKS